MPTPPKPNELGYKDTVVAFPGQVTRIKAKFDIAGLYVWHCHIVEHEDNEMMRPLLVLPGARIDFNNDGKADILWRNAATGANAVWYMDGVTLTGIGDLPALPNPDYAIVGRVTSTGTENRHSLEKHRDGRECGLVHGRGDAHGSCDFLRFPIRPMHCGTGDFNGDGKPIFSGETPRRGQMGSGIWTG